MNQIITIGREFGSGGRELGRRLAEELGVEYYDKEIVEQIAAHTSFSEEYVHQIMEGKHHRLYPITVNHTFNFAGDAHAQILSSVFQAQYQILKNLAQLSSCVIVGRCADYLLRSYSPQRLFVYADMESRLKRCMERNDDSHRYSEREIERLIRRVDSRRARYYRDHTGQKWGDKQYYDFCINTTGKDIKAMVKHVAGLLSDV